MMDNWSRHALVIEDLFATAAIIDPGTGDPIWQPLHTLLGAWADHLNAAGHAVPLDLTLRTARFLGPTLDAIVSRPRDRHTRASDLLPPHKVRELDARCMAWIMRQPGRTAREKVAARGRVRAVTRPVTVDLAENRVTRRVARDLAHHARGALEQAPDDGAHPKNQSRKRELRRLLRLTTDTIATSALGAVPPDLCPRANNVLLEDQRYRKVWRAWLGLRRAIPTRMDGPNLLQALFWSLVSELSRRTGCVVGDIFCRVVLGRSAGTLDVSVEPGSGKVRAVAAAGPDKAVQIALRPEPGAEVVSGFSEVWERDGDVVRASSMERVELTATVLPQRVAVEVGIHRNGRTEAYSAPPDLSGIRSLVEALQTSLLPPAPVPGELPMLRVEGPAAPPAQGWRESGWDIGGPYLVADTDNGAQVRPSTPLIAVPVQIQDDTSLPSVLVGDSAAERVAVETNSPRVTLCGLWKSLLDEENDGEEHRRAVRELLTGLASGPRSPARGAALAVTMFDWQNEAGQAFIAASLPTGLAERWLIWRSVAAALAWRDELGFAKADVNKGDAVLVLDGDGPRLSGTWLFAAEQPPDEHATQVSDPWVWERVQLPPDLYRGAPAGLEELDTRLLAELLQPHLGCQAVEHARSLVQEGWLAALHEPGCPDRAWLPVPEGSPEDIRRIVVDRQALEHESLPDRCPNGTRLADWIQEAAKSIGLQPGQMPTHLLAVGRLWSRPGAEQLLLDTAADALPGARVHQAGANGALFAQGARVFLRRHRQGLPTWRERIPDLFLEPKGGARVRIFAGRQVVPGQRLSFKSKQAFVLPEGVNRVELPLVREGDGRPEQAVVACLQHRSFPLDQPVPVVTEVGFRFARDAFRVSVLPREPEAKLFDRLDLEWRAGEVRQRGAVGKVRLDNSPPELPDRIPWADATPAAVRDFCRISQQIRDEVEYLNEESQLCTLRALRSGRRREHGAPIQEEVNQLKSALNRLVKMLEGLKKLVEKDLWPIWRETSPPPGPAASALQANLLVSLCTVLGLILDDARPGQGIKKRNGKKKRRPRGLAREWSQSQLRDPGLVKLRDRLQRRSIRLCSRLRWEAPQSYIELLLARRRGHVRLLNDHRTERFHCLGRVLGDGSSNASRKALKVSLASPVHTTVGDLPLLNARVWCLATALWTHPDLAHNLDEQVVEQTLELCSDTLDGLAGSWSTEGIAPELLNETGSVLMGLLRLRGTEHGTRLLAGEKWPELLAGKLERARGEIIAAGGLLRRSRLQISDAEEFILHVVHCLRGERRARIRMLED